MSILRKQGKCAECRGVIEAGSRVEWVSSGFSNRHPGNGTVISTGSANRPKHADYMDCFRVQTDRELGLLKSRSPEGYKFIMNFMEKKPSKGELHAYLDTLPDSWKVGDSYIVATTLGV